MKLSINSKKLMTFFIKNNHINHFHQTEKTNHILAELYNDILESYNYLLSLKKEKGTKFYNLSIKNIQSVSQITSPNNFNSNSFPEKIRKHIDETSFSEIVYHFHLFDKDIKLYFIVEDTHVDLNIEKYNKYVDYILLWLHILNQYASKKCANSLIVYFYFTSLEKKLPDSNILILNENHVNTAFTTTCPKDSEIVIFRSEEWFKVFIHETFHNFGLDFSDMNNDICTRQILSIFPVKSNVNLYESYCEFWAEIMNALFCSFLQLKDKKNMDEFLKNSEFLINIERTYSFFQLVKTLDFMGLKYKDLYTKNKNSQILRETLYKEDTNVLSYYIIKTILLNNYQGFLSWSKRNNFSLLQFKKTIANQKEYCVFIDKNYKTKSMIEGIANTELLIQKLNNSNIKHTRNYKYITSNLRMSICELG